MATAAHRVLPDDVYQESGFRLPLARREDMNDEDQQVFDAAIAGRTSAARGPAGPGVGQRGPGGIQMHSPQYAKRAQATNWYLRFASGIPGRTRELAILVAAREMNQQFEWTGHEPMAVREGLEPDVIDIVRNRGSVDGLSEADACLITLGREATHGPVTPETFARALAAFGSRMLVDLVGLIGEYVSVAILLNTFGMEMPDDWEPLLTDL